MLFVDDEPSIRLTLPSILDMHGFEVYAVGSVADALNAINSRTFDVLLADLNIGEPGDGFTVVSAMRRSQPDAVTIILTGFPAFETALEAIRAQVDDYVVKPANIEHLLHTIEQRLVDHQPHRPVPLRRVSAILRDSVDDVVRQWLVLVSADEELQQVRLSEAERSDHVPGMIYEMVDMLQLHPESVSDDALQAAAHHGRTRRRQGYNVPMLLKEGQLLRRVISQIVQQNLLAVDISHLIGDLIQSGESIDRQVKRSVEAFLAEERAPNPKAA
ncbi:MAG TPA: response regulator [Terriglobales bacterium]|nr:response regulator [Terriglobales bacterium]